MVLALSRCRAVMCGGTSAQDTSAEQQSVSCVEGGIDFLRKFHVQSKETMVEEVEGGDGERYKKHQKTKI